MPKSSVNLQDSFLNQVRKDNSQVRIVLTNGQEMTGQVRGFDNFTVIMSSGGNQNLIYKHAIAQIITKKTSRRENAPSRKNASSDHSKKDKSQGFNTIDVSNIKIESEE